MPRFIISILALLALIFSSTTTFTRAQEINPANSATPFPPSMSASENITPDELLGQRIASVSRRKSMSNEQGQFYREYDITPYTQQRGFQVAARPEQTLIDWILRQTGNATWHTNAESILAATPEKLYVYHNIDAQKIAADVVDRFVAQQAATDYYTVRLISVGRPDWISRGHTFLRPIPIETPGVQGWLVDKAEQPRLFAEFARRSDFRDYTTAPITIPNAGKHEIASLRPRTYTRDVQPSSQVPGFVSDVVSIDEGFRLAMVPLTCLDGQTCDLMVQGDFVQVEKMLQTPLELANPLGNSQRHMLETPQLVKFHLDEQIRFPRNKTLILDLGMLGALPETDNTAPQNQILSSITSSINRVVAPNATRVNYLLVIEAFAGNVNSNVIGSNVVANNSAASNANPAAIPAILSSSTTPASTTASPAPANGYWQRR